MKTSRIISKAIATLLCIFACTAFLAAQRPVPPTPPATTKSTTTSSKKSSQKVNINMDGNKLRLEMDDDQFDLDMAFDFDATNVIAAITDELGSPMSAGRYKVWEGNGFDIKVKNNNLDVFIDRNSVSKTTLNHMEQIFKELFKDLELDIDINH